MVSWWRNQKAEARAVVHDTFKVRGLLLFPASAPTGKEFNIRVHEKKTALGDQAGTSLNAAERFEAIPKIIFWRADLIAAGVTKIDTNSVVSVTAGEAYNIDAVEPHDQETITCHVTRLSATKAAGLPLPVG